jgi:nucleotide-binding universal stress UspA family protein
MVKTILIPLDGSDFAEEALPLGRVLAAKAGAEVHLVHVVLPEPDVDFKTPQEDLEWRERVRDGAERYLSAHAEAARAAGVSALTAVLEGPVADALLDYAAEQEVDLIALTSHGEGGVRRFWLGSVADALLRSGQVDVLVVRPWDETEERSAGEPRFARILVPLDGSEAAERALGPATELAERLGASLVALRVVPKPMELTSIYGVPGVELRGERHQARVQEATAYVGAVAERISRAHVEGHVVESSGAADGIVDAARALEADLVVLTSRGHGEMTRLVIGSVADKVVRTTTRPVWVVHAGGGS